MSIAVPRNTDLSFQFVQRTSKGSGTHHSRVVIQQGCRGSSANGRETQHRGRGKLKSGESRRGSRRRQHGRRGSNARLMVRAHQVSHRQLGRNSRRNRSQLQCCFCCGCRSGGARSSADKIGFQHGSFGNGQKAKKYKK